MIEVRAMEAADAPRWRVLWAAYNRFYEASVAEHVTEQTLARLLDHGSSLIGRVAVHGGNVVGFSASVIHDATWDTRAVCYLEDLYVDEAARGSGAGRALIEDLIALAHQNNWGRLYWHTRAGNDTARRLYDRFTQADDFVRYRLFF